VVHRGGQSSPTLSGTGPTQAGSVSGQIRAGGQAWRKKSRIRSKSRDRTKSRRRSRSGDCAKSRRRSRSGDRAKSRRRSRSGDRAKSRGRSKSRGLARSRDIHKSPTANLFAPPPTPISPLPATPKGSRSRRVHGAAMSPLARQFTPPPAPISPLPATPTRSQTSADLVPPPPLPALSSLLPRTYQRADTTNKLTWSLPNLAISLPAASVLPDSPPASEVDLLHFELPYGWRKTGNRRQGTEKWDFFLFSPSGNRLKGRRELVSFLGTNPEVLIDSSVTHHGCPWNKRFKRTASGLEVGRGVGRPQKQHPRLNLFNTV
jgi:hypothetical protein